MEVLGASVKDDRANENKLEIIEQSYPTNRSNKKNIFENCDFLKGLANN